MTETAEAGVVATTAVTAMEAATTNARAGLVEGRVRRPSTIPLIAKDPLKRASLVPPAGERSVEACPTPVG
jgi:hypothetical protein